MMNETQIWENIDKLQKIIKSVKPTQHKDPIGTDYYLGIDLNNNDDRVCFDDSMCKYPNNKCLECPIYKSL